MLAIKIKHSLHKSSCGQVDVGLLFWASAYRQRRYIKPKNHWQFFERMNNLILDDKIG